MPFRQLGPLLAYEFEALSRPQILHAVFSRHGGLSPAPWRSLNLGGTVGDDRQRVSANLDTALRAVGRRPESVYDVWQVHSAKVVRAREARGDVPPIQADGIITDDPRITLLMRFADCVPILLFDPVNLAVGIVHAGWLGTVRKAASAAVLAMSDSFGSRPDQLIACLGPSIGPDHYPVGPEVVASVRESFGRSAEDLLQNHNGSIHFDLWSANRVILEGEGVRAIEIAGYCTACHLEDWYSHRGEGGSTGRFGALIALSGRA